MMTEAGGGRGAQSTTGGAVELNLPSVASDVKIVSSLFSKNLAAAPVIPGAIDNANGECQGGAVYINTLGPVSLLSNVFKKNWCRSGEPDTDPNGHVLCSDTRCSGQTSDTSLAL